jgi:hypothetical protein
MLEKIASAADLKGVLVKTASVVRRQDARIRELEAENAAFRRKAELEKIAHEGVTRGVVDDPDNFVGRWAHDDTPLEVLADFVERTTPGVPLGELGEGHEKVAGSGSDVLSTFLSTQDPGSY